MNRQWCERLVSGCVLAGAMLALSGCATLGGPAADLGLAGAGGVAGYHLADHQGAGAAVGAVAGYAASRIAQSRVEKEITAVEQRGYDRALNQAVKQQYWIIQNRQKAPEGSGETEARVVPVLIPETTIDGVTTNARIEYLRVQ